MKKASACLSSVFLVLLILLCGCAEQTRFQPLEVKEFGYSVINGEIVYAACIHNPNESMHVNFSTIRVSAKDANGVILGTKEDYLNQIYPQQDVWISWSGCEVEEDPLTVIVEVKPYDESSVRKVSKAQHQTYIPLRVINYAKREKSYSSWIDSTLFSGYKIVGEIINENDYSIKSANVTVVYRDEEGKIIGGQTEMVSSIAANGTTPFEMDEYANYSFGDSIELYASMVD